MNKVKVRVNYALKAATGQRQVEAAAHRARRVQLENTTGTKVARSTKGVRIVPLEPLVQNVQVPVIIAALVNTKIKMDKLHAKIAKQENIKTMEVKHHAKIAVLVNTIRMMEHN